MHSVDYSESVTLKSAANCSHTCAKQPNNGRAIVHLLCPIMMWRWEGGRSRGSWHTRTHAHALTHTQREGARGSSRHKEDGGRCGSGGADLHPAAAASLMEAGELAARRVKPRSLSLSADTSDTSAAVQSGGQPRISPCCVVVKGTVHRRRSVCWLCWRGAGGSGKQNGAFQRKCHTRIQMHRTDTPAACTTLCAGPKRDRPPGCHEWNGP